MELHSLRLFLAVCETESFTGAAKKLFVSHSTVSRAVSSLEEELGVTLFDRKNKVFGLTEAGERLRQGAAELLEAVQKLEDEMRAEQ